MNVPVNVPVYTNKTSRRAWLGKMAVGLSATTLIRLGGTDAVAVAEEPAAESPKSASSEPTQFQIACMTLPYGHFPLDRALTGISKAGYKYVAWGTTHRETPGGKKVPVMAADAPPAKAKQLAARCRDLGLEPVMMFSGIYPEAENAVKVMTSRIHQAAAAGIKQVLTFGDNEGSNQKLWIERFKLWGRIAGDHGVMIVLKQHGGTTGTGEICAKIIQEVASPNVLVNYDAGNVMWYLNVDPIPDMQKCAKFVRSFCIKDGRGWPEIEDCGPGFGEIDHYRLLHPVAFTGREMPLCCENIFAPLVPRPATPEGVDVLARRARLYLETVIAGLHRKNQKREDEG